MESGPRGTSLSQLPLSPETFRRLFRSNTAPVLFLQMEPPAYSHCPQVCLLKCVH